MPIHAGDGAAPPPPSNDDLAEMFDEIGDLLEIQGENPFKIRAYRRASEELRALLEPVAPLGQDELRTVPGVGEAIAAKIEERVQTGRLRFLDRLHEAVPASARDLLHIPGIGPKTAGKLLSAGIVSRQHVLAAVESGALAGLVGKAAADRVGRGLAAVEPRSSRFDLMRAAQAAARGLELMRRVAGVRRVEVAGSTRRFAERVGDVNLAALAEDPAAARRAALEQVGGEAFEPLGMRFPAAGLMIAVRFADAGMFGSLWQWWTGSAQHNDRLAERAAGHGLVLGPFGFVRTDGAGFADEESLYAALGLAYIPPELREARGEIAAAAEGRLPDLLTVAELRGDLHVHTDWSDGSEPLEAMVAGARARGYEYLAITDHSGGRAVASGLDATRLLKQIERVRAYNAAHPEGPRVLVGSEVDIRADGSLDYPDELLAKLDVVIASIHSAMDQPREKMTARIISAARNRYVTALGHLTGRLIGRRDPVQLDVEAVLRAAAAAGTWAEINSHPSRLDLCDDHVRLAKAFGVPIIVTTDAHAVGHYDLASYGVAIARRAWLTAADVVNTLPLGLFLDRLSAKRKRDDEQ